MKYLKYILGIIGILVIVFLLMGIIKPELSYECEILVDKPVSESMAVAQDQEKLSKWLTGFHRIEHISGTPGTVGAVSNVYFDNNGQEASIQETITDIVPNESISMTYESDFMDMNYKMTMSDINGKTKISTNTTTAGNGIISKSIIAFIGNSIKAQEEENLDRLKETIERNTKNYVQTE